VAVELDEAQMGPPGFDGVLLFEEVGPIDRRPMSERLADRTLRTFQLKALLAKQSVAEDAISASVIAEKGGCYIGAPDDLKIDTPTGSFVVMRNSRGELAVIEGTVNAGEWQEAFHRFQESVTPWIDHLAYFTNTPIVVSMLQCRDDANHYTAVTYRMPYSNLSLSEGALTLSSWLLPVYALYREALSSDQNLYRFLCYFKALEGVFTDIRPRFLKLTRERRINIKMSKETVPADPELEKFKATYIGRSIHDLYTSEFRTEFRNAIAHFRLDDGSSISPSSYRGATAVGANVLLIQLCAREVIERQEDYFRQFFASGGVLC